VEVEYPIGHRRRRAEGIPLLKEKFARALRTVYAEKRAARIEEVMESPDFDGMAVDRWMSMLAMA